MTIEQALLAAAAIAAAAVVLVRPLYAVIGVAVLLFVQAALLGVHDLAPATKTALKSAEDVVLVMLVARTAAAIVIGSHGSWAAMRGRVHPWLWGLAIFAAIGIASAVVNRVPVVTAGVGIYLSIKVGLWFFVAASLEVKPRWVVVFGYVLGGLFIGAVAVAVLQVIGVHTPWPTTERAGGPAATSIWGQHTVFGSALSVAAGLAVVALSLPGERLAGLVLGAVAAVGVFLSSVRRLLVSIPVALLGLFLLLPAAAREPVRRPLAALRRPAVLVLTGAVLLGVAVVAAPRLANLAARTYEEYVVDAAARDRYELYGGAVRLVEHSPLLGRGPGTYGSYASVLFHSPVYGELGLRVPNKYKMGAPYASLVGEFGLLGLVAFLAAIVLLARSLFRWTRGLTGSVGAALSAAALFMVVNMLIESVVHPTFRDSFIGFFVFVGAGLAAGFARTPERDEVWDPGSLPGWSRPAAVALGVLLVAAIWLVVAVA